MYAFKYEDKLINLWFPVEFYRNCIRWWSEPVFLGFGSITLNKTRVNKGSSKDDRFSARNRLELQPINQLHNMMILWNVSWVGSCLAYIFILWNILWYLNLNFYILTFAMQSQTLLKVYAFYYIYYKTSWFSIAKQYLLYHSFQ